MELPYEAPGQGLSKKMKKETLSKLNHVMMLGQRPNFDNCFTSFMLPVVYLYGGSAIVEGAVFCFCDFLLILIILLRQL
jgi:hypothetical protein